jgi:hypothetical protein
MFNTNLIGYYLEDDRIEDSWDLGNILIPEVVGRGESVGPYVSHFLPNSV